MAALRSRALWALVSVAAWSGAAAAEPIILRMASVVPEGTGWARELKAFGREVQAGTSDEVQIKWYLSGIAGDELASHGRVQRDQLDGIVSGGMLCQKLAPSLRAIAMVGEFRDTGEAKFVLNRLRPTLDEEMLKAGYVLVGPAGMGFSVLFSRQPVRTTSELHKLRPWLWSLDESVHQHLDVMGLHVVSLPVEESGRAFDEGRVDGFVALPTAALAFQWSAQARYVTDLKFGYLTGCLVISRRAWDLLGHEQQLVVTSAGAKLQARIEAVSQQDDRALMSGLFSKQGLTVLPASPALQAEFNDTARKTLGLVEKLAPPGTFRRVQQMLAEYRRQAGAAVRR